MTSHTPSRDIRYAGPLAAAAAADADGDDGDGASPNPPTAPAASAAAARPPGHTPDATLMNWVAVRQPPPGGMRPNAVVDMGWGRLIFGHTFLDDAVLVRTMHDEAPGRRDVAFYVRDPHVLVSLAPDQLFLDPSHTYRLWRDHYRGDRADRRNGGMTVRRAASEEDAAAINRIYAARHMVPIDAAFLASNGPEDAVQFVIAADANTGEVVGAAAGVDHVVAFNDPEGGASLWSLAADGQAPQPGVGRALLRYLVEHYLARGRAYVDRSVMHDNAPAIALYERLGFTRVPVFCMKHKNAINEPLFVPAPPEANLNPYARIIIDEARRRGIGVEVIDEGANLFALTCGGRRVVCRESLSELTTAVAMTRCDDKRVTLRALQKAGLRVPVQQEVTSPDADRAFLGKFKRVVVKPVRGEQGRGISVDVRTPADLAEAIGRARRESDDVVIEQFCDGMDLRVVVIGYEVVAAAVRRPAQVVGNGRHPVRKLIEQQSKRRMAATGGESRIPMDAETERCVQAGGATMDTILPAGRVLPVRKAANLHTGGTIHDVTGQLHPVLADAAVRAARALEIPVTGLDFLVPKVAGPDYVFIEANERPGLANHEPQPTAQRFVDLLFPQTAAATTITAAAPAPASVTAAPRSRRGVRPDEETARGHEVPDGHAAPAAGDPESVGVHRPDRALRRAGTRPPRHPVRADPPRRVRDDARRHPEGARPGADRARRHAGRWSSRSSRTGGSNSCRSARGPADSPRARG